MHKILLTLLILVTISFSQVVVQMDLTGEWANNGQPAYFELYHHTADDSSLNPFSASTVPSAQYLVESFVGSAHIISTNADTVFYQKNDITVNADGKYNVFALYPFNSDSTASDGSVSNWYRTTDLSEYPFLKFFKIRN